jgi:hypothetical protein
MFLIENEIRKIQIIFDIKKYFESSLLVLFEEAPKLGKASRDAYN